MTSGSVFWNNAITDVTVKNARGHAQRALGQDALIRDNAPQCEHLSHSVERKPLRIRLDGPSQKGNFSPHLGHTNRSDGFIFIPVVELYYLPSLHLLVI